MNTDRISKIMARLNKEDKYEMSMREMLKITRKVSEGSKSSKDNKGTKSTIKILNEDISPNSGVDSAERVNNVTNQDQEREESNLNGMFQDLTVDLELFDLEVYDDFVFWGGVINNMIEFTYVVPPITDSTGVEFKYTEDFNKENEDNTEIIKRIESYYVTFNKYWIENINK